MEKQIIFECDTCKSEEFIKVQYKFDSFTEAYNNMIEYRDHYMIAKLPDESDE